MNSKKTAKGGSLWQKCHLEIKMVPEKCGWWCRRWGLSGDGGDCAGRWLVISSTVYPQARCLFTFTEEPDRNGESNRAVRDGLHHFQLAGKNKQQPLRLCTALTAWQAPAAKAHRCWRIHLTPPPPVPEHQGEKRQGGGTAYISAAVYVDIHHSISVRPERPLWAPPSRHLNAGEMLRASLWLTASSVSWSGWCSLSLFPFLSFSLSISLPRSLSLSLSHILILSLRFS